MEIQRLAEAEVAACKTAGLQSSGKPGMTACHLTALQSLHASPGGNFVYLGMIKCLPLNRGFLNMHL
ncbi:MAG: hypothetical protein C4520_18245 [Candidatus Abyssobacteria bacterium SURF_5]|uniref:Uncharacterized protein n=1 Tax=Abyssobacteria bacterium (strain SURF_5) TaxID=2093360 RepID=A0A3A4ND20_ABYX5|nr:MAG: hypothetical protein C4520_18245 [Candidatus Abyssubacteria bacterium SURF_5]